MKRLLGLLIIGYALFPSAIQAAATKGCFCYYLAASGIQYCASSGVTAGEAYCQADCAAFYDGTDADPGSGINVPELTTFTSTETATTFEAEGCADNAEPAAATVSTSSAPTLRPLLTPQLEIPIPNLSFAKAVANSDVVTSNFIGEYVSGVYKFLLGFALTIAIVMMMIGGLQYVIGASAGEVGKAKDRIRNAIVGFVLLLFVYVILFTVNPQTTLFPSLGLTVIDPVKFIADSGDAGGTVTTENMDLIGIDCPESGDVGTIAKSFMGKTSYRLGGKGGSPPYPLDTKTCEGTACSTFCPSGTVCLDCSGYVALVAQCAGLSPKNESGGTVGIFGNAESITSCTSNSVTTASGTFALTPGDLIGFKAGDYSSEPKNGHVWMYIGDNQLINSAGSGRASGKAVTINSLTWACGKYPLRFVDR